MSLDVTNYTYKMLAHNLGYDSLARKKFFNTRNAALVGIGICLTMLFTAAIPSSVAIGIYGTFAAPLAFKISGIAFGLPFIGGLVSMTAAGFSLHRMATQKISKKKLKEILSENIKNLKDNDLSYNNYWKERLNQCTNSDEQQSISSCMQLVNERFKNSYAAINKIYREINMPEDCLEL